ncbi:MAG: beta-ketoacyl-[acyl-carrier-protein] synthase family protein [Planctomycetia bacterium]|nr:beta-ketoacyl-[acyl-carrier-protein] synthase family protein [Planctomycetia bacterium]
MINSEAENSKRIVITGLGLISAAGFTTEELWKACTNGESGIKPFSFPGSDFPRIRYAGAVDQFTGKIDDFGPLDPVKSKAIRKGLKLMSREIQMGVASAQRALNDADIEAGSIPSNRLGVSFASDYIITTPEEVQDGMKACKEGDQFDFSRWPSQGLTKMTPIWQLKFLTNMPASHIAIYNEFFGFANAITDRESSIGTVIAEAAEVIRKGKIDLMLVGATGSRIHPFKMIHTLQQDEIADPNLDPAKACRPFDADRTGTVPGEGAGALILEDLDHALARKATIYAEVAGGSCRCATHLRRGRTSGCLLEGDIEKSITLTLSSLLEKTGLDPDKLGHLNAEGFGGQKSDAMEAKAIRAVFGKRADTLPITALKGHLGNPGAGSGALELIASILALKNNALFPILNNEKDDPDCPIHPVREFGGDPGDSFIKLAWQSAGQSSAILVKRYE